MTTPRTPPASGAAAPSRTARTITVLGASGGLGTSTLATALATRARPAYPTTACVDVHPDSGGLDVFFDHEALPAVRWPDLSAARGRLDGPALAQILPEVTPGLVVLASATTSPTTPTDPALPDATVVRATLDALSDAVDLLILDAGTRCDTLPDSDDLILVVGCTVPALARAARVAADLDRRLPAHTRIWVVQRCPRGRGDLADQVAERLGLPLLGLIEDDPGIDRHLARGHAPATHPGRLRRAVDRLWGNLLTAQDAA
ncbi:hypothetical protein KEM60_01090 [Austwickia sp. TVS 96-490-7B]|uniref:hypothetical protein n=1 Tax=Austwickia sp. TVS 96-490-7B TaxID=2830843 RepID=UPI001C570919|nr:hypothetical protein [Austwickia sp. TVS 96-490-7B]MBW3084900.1 hypothetical protein [Austwickia sp. TVS 96-490-7B]